MITREKIQQLRTWIGDNSLSFALFCEDCDHFVNDHTWHRSRSPNHKTEAINIQEFLLSLESLFHKTFYSLDDIEND